MTRYLLDSEAEADAALAEGAGSVLRYLHPLGDYEVFVRDLVTAPGSEPALLSFQVVFDATSIDEAQALGEAHLKDFLQHLTFATNLTFKVHRNLQIFNWENPGEKMREARMLAGFPDPNKPLKVLNKAILETIRQLQRASLNPRVRRALKWFANGVSSEFLDDQFTYFWFVIEILAQVIKEPLPVPDQCPRCKTPLYCPTCEDTPVHKPYAKHAIENLFQAYVRGDADDFYARASAVRHRLLHGEDIAAIEEAMGIEFSKLVDDLGNLAWVALFNHFKPQLEGFRPFFWRVRRYTHMKMTMNTHLEFGFTPQFDDPHPNHFPKIEVTMISRSPGNEDEIRHYPIGTRHPNAGAKPVKLKGAQGFGCPPHGSYERFLSPGVDIGSPHSS